MTTERNGKVGEPHRYISTCLTGSIYSAITLMDNRDEYRTSYFRANLLTSIYHHDYILYHTSRHVTCCRILCCTKSFNPCQDRKPSSTTDTSWDMSDRTGRYAEKHRERRKLLQVERLCGDDISPNFAKGLLEFLFQLGASHDLGSLCHLP